MPNYKFTYFDIRALGEPIRFIFAVAGVEYVDNRVKFEDWAELKAKSGYGQLPILEVDGEQITQSAAIMRYLGAKHDLLPVDPLLSARCDEIGCQLDEIRAKFRDFASCLIRNKPEEAEQAETIRKELNESYFPKYFTIFDKMIGKTSGAYIAWEKLSWADLALASWINIYSEFAAGPNLLDNYPNLKKMYDTVFALPAIKAYVASRPNAIV